MNCKYKIKSFILFFFLFNSFFNLINLSCASFLASESRKEDLNDIFINSLNEFIGTYDGIKRKGIEVALPNLLEIKPANLKLFNVEGVSTSDGKVTITSDIMSKFFKISYNYFAHYLISYKFKNLQLVSADSLLQADVFIFFINNLLSGISDEDTANSYSAALQAIKKFFISNKTLYELYKSIFINNSDINISGLKEFFSVEDKEFTESDYPYIAKNECCKEVLFERLRDAILKFQQFKEAKIREGNGFFDLRGINLNHILLPAFFDDSSTVSGFHLDLLYRRPCNECRSNIDTDFKRFIIAYSCINLVTVDVIEKDVSTIDQKTFFPSNWQLDDLFKTIYELYQDISNDEKLSSTLDYPNSQVLYKKYMEQYGFPVFIVIRNDSECPGAPIKKMVTIFPITSVPINVAKIIEYKNEREESLKYKIRGYPEFYPMRFNYKKIDFEYGKFTCKLLPRNYDSLLAKFEDSKFMNLSRVKQFISLGFHGYKGNTFLHLAVLNQNIEVVDYILNSGLYSAYSEDSFGKSNFLNQLIDCYNSEGKTPYMLAIDMKDKSESSNKIAKLFEENLPPVEIIEKKIAPVIEPTIEELSQQINDLDKLSVVLKAKARSIATKLKDDKKIIDGLNDEIVQLSDSLESINGKEDADKIQKELDEKKAELAEITSNIALKEDEKTKATGEAAKTMGLLADLMRHKDYKERVASRILMKEINNNLSENQSSSNFGFSENMSVAF